MFSVQLYNGMNTVEAFVVSRWNTLNSMFLDKGFGSKFTKDFYTAYNIFYDDQQFKGQLEKPMRLAIRVTRSMSLGIRTKAKTIYTIVGRDENDNHFILDRRIK